MDRVTQRAEHVRISYAVPVGPCECSAARTWIHLDLPSVLLHASLNRPSDGTWDSSAPARSELQLIHSHADDSAWPAGTPPA